MSSTRTAAIAGAGIAGLTAAAALARYGFTVRVYERSDDPREFGAGIYMKDNSLPVLDQLGIGERVAESGVRIQSAQIIDERRETIVKRDVSSERLIIMLRSTLHNALRDAAVDAGVEILTGKHVVKADPRGRLELASGESVEADLIVAADGVRSKVRESLGLTHSFRTMQDGATRLLIPRTEEPISREYWGGNMRVGVAPCSPDLTYVFMIGPERDRRCGRLPVDVQYWSERFPHLVDVFDRITPDSGVHHPHEHVVCKSWTKGRVAIIGDAAHAQPPNLGQGAGLAIAAAWELARTAADSTDVPAQLVDWERRVRPSVDRVQKFTTLYSHTGYYWPSPALRLRADLFHWLSVVPATAQSWEYWWRGGTYAPRNASIEDETIAEP